MRRHSTTGRTPAKVRPIKAAKPRRTNKLKAARRASSSVGDLQNQVSALTRQLAEAREQQTATADVLRVISSSAGDLQPVFAAMLENAVRICGASFGSMLLFEGEQLRRVAMHNAPASYVEYAAQKPVIHYSVSGVITRLRDTRRPEHTRDLLAEDRNDPLAKFAGARTVVSVPMLKHDELIGLIAIYRREVRPFADKQVELVANFAAQAVIAIENARLLTETREALEKQTATAEVLGIINSSPGELAPVFEAIASAAAPLCDAANSAVFRFDGSLIHLTAQYGLTAAQLDTLRDTFPLAPGRGSVTARAIMTGQVVHVPDLATDVEFAHPSFVGAGLRGSVSVPMLREDVAIGAITVTRQESRSFTDKQIALLENFAAQAVIAIENARLLSKLRESLEQQTATSDILASISGSLTDPRPVFNAIVHNLRRLFGARWATVQLLQGETIEMPAADGEVATEKIMQHYPRPLDNTSVGGQAMLTNQVVQYAPVLDNPVVPAAAQQMARDYQYNSIIAAPMIRQDTVVGAIVCGNPEPRVFDEKEVALIKSFAAQAVIAIENARLLTELRESLEHQTASSEVLQAINASPGDLAPVFGAIVDKAMHLCEAGFGGLWIVDGGLARAAATRNLPEAFAEFVTREALPHADAFGRGVRNKPVVHIADMTATESYRKRVPMTVASVELGGVRTYLAVALRQGGAVAGVLMLYRQEVRPFSDRQIALVQGFAAQAEIAMRNARLLNETRASLERQTATSEVLRVISSSPGDLEPVFSSMLENAVRICDASFGNIYRWDGAALHHLASRNTPAAFARQRSREPFRPAPINPVGQMIAGKTVIHLPDAAASQAYAEREAVTVAGVEIADIRTFLAVPMLKENELIGAIALARQDVRPFTDKQIELVANFAAQAVIAIENARLLTELRAAY